MKKQLLVLKYKGLKLVALKSISGMTDEDFTKVKAVENVNRIFDEIIKDLQKL